MHFSVKNYQILPMLFNSVSMGLLTLTITPHQC